MHTNTHIVVFNSYLDMPHHPSPLSEIFYSPLTCNLHTVSVEIFTQYIFSCMLRRALDARKFDVSENYYYNSTQYDQQLCEQKL